MKNPRAWVVPFQILKGEPYYLLGRRGPMANNPGVWGFFGGNKDGQETAVETAVREFEEEAMVQVKPEALSFLFKSVVVGKPCTWFAFDWAAHPTAILTLDTTPEVVDYDWTTADRLPVNDGLHYSAEHYFQWIELHRKTAYEPNFQYLRSRGLL